MTAREQALVRIVVGDLFHATSPNNASLLCLADKITDASIVARSITSRFVLEFNRLTGTAQCTESGRSVTCLIESVASLPGNVREILFGLDRKYATPSDGHHPLTEDEKRALVFAARFFPQHPLPMPPETMSIGRETADPVAWDDYDRMTAEQQVEFILSNYLIPAERS